MPPAEHVCATAERTFIFWSAMTTPNYQWKRLGPSLAKGSLTEEERRALERYTSSIIASDGTLKHSALPRFQPDANGGAVGTVSEPQ